VLQCVLVQSVVPYRCSELHLDLGRSFFQRLQGIQNPGRPDRTPLACLDLYALQTLKQTPAWVQVLF